MLQGVCFDLGGTLGRYSGEFSSILLTLAGELGGGPELAAKVGPVLNEELNGDGPLTSEVALRRTLERLALPVPQDVSRIASVAAGQYIEGMRPLPGAAELLDELHAAGAKLALVSNGAHDMQLGALRALGFERYFSVVLISGDRDVAARKPAPRIFGLACTGLQSLPEQTLMVGDDLRADIQGALGYGLQAVHVGGSVQEGALPEGAVAVADLLELRELLKGRTFT